MAANTNTQHRSDQDAFAEMVAWAMGAAATLAATVISAPGLLAGSGLAWWLRRRALSWTWAPVLGAGAAMPLLVVGPGDAWMEVRTHAEAFAHVHPLSDAGALPGWLARLWLTCAPALVPFWLAGIGPVALVLKLYWDRRDRLHGGQAARSVDNATGPVRALRNHLRARRMHTQVIDAQARAWLGRDVDTGEPVTVELDKVVHVLNPGASRQGKTHTQQVIGDAARQLRWSRLNVDPKADTAYALREYQQAKAAGQPFVLFSMGPFGIAALDACRRPFVPLSHGSATEGKDAFCFSQAWESPHYLGIVERGVLAALTAQHATGQRPDLKTTAALLRDPARLAAALAAIDSGRYAEQIGWLRSLTSDETSALRGAANRAARLIEGDGGAVLLPHPDVEAIDLHRLLMDGATVHFAVDLQAYPTAGPQIIAYILSALSATAGQFRAANIVVPTLALIDEAGALEGSQGRALIERCGDVKIRTWWAPQTLSAIEERCGLAMRDALVENANLIIAHRQSTPDAAQLLADVAGTREDYEHSHLVDEYRRSLLTGDEPGRHTRRLTDTYRAHPNRIKNLQQGQALLINKDANPPRRALRPDQGADRQPGRAGRFAARCRAGLRTVGAVPNSPAKGAATGRRAGRARRGSSRGRERIRSTAGDGGEREPFAFALRCGAAALLDVLRVRRPDLAWEIIGGPRDGFDRADASPTGPRKVAGLVTASDDPHPRGEVAAPLAHPHDAEDAA
jgi:hypothetical protein